MELQILSHIKVDRLRWVGHVQRINGNEMAKKIMDNTPVGRRKAQIWMDALLEDIRILKITNW